MLSRIPRRKAVVLIFEMKQPGKQQQQKQQLEKALIVEWNSFWKEKCKLCFQPSICQDIQATC